MPAPNAKITISAVDKTKRAFSQARGRMNSLVGTSAKLTGALGGVAVAGFGALIASSLKSNDALAKTADQLGFTTESLRGLQLAGELAGVSQSKLDSSLDKLNVRLGEAQRGTGLAKQSLDELGLSATKLSGLKADERFLQIADAVNKVEDRTKQAKIAMDIFGRSGGDLLVLFDQGTDSIRKTVSEAEALGTALSRVDAAKIEQANDAVTKVKAVFEGFVNRLAVQFAPIIQGIATELKNAALESGGFQQKITQAFDIGVRAVGVFADGFRGLQVVFGVAEIAVNGIIKKFGELALTGAKIKDFFSGGNSAAFWEGFVNAANDGLNEVQVKVNELALSPLPSQKIAEAVEGYKKIAQAGAESAAKIRAAQQENSLGGGGEASPNIKEQERIKEKFKLLQAETEGELSLLKVRAELKLAQDLELAQQAFDSKFVTEQEHMALTEELRLQHEERLFTQKQDFINREAEQERQRISNILSMNENLAKRQEEIDKLSKQGQRQLATTAFRDAISIAASGSKKIFEVNKKLALADATVNGFKAIVSGFATSPFFPVGIAMGALATAKTFATIKSIKATSFGGGTPGGVSTGSVAPPISTQNNSVAQAPEVTGPNKSKGQATISFNESSGELLTRDQVMRLMQQQNELRDDGFTDVAVQFS